MTVALSKVGAGLVVQPRDMNELWSFCQTISKSSFVPKDFRDRPGDVLAAVQMGAELGLAPMAALQNICVINGRPSIWGDALLAIILAHPECKELEETYDAKTKTAKCRVVRVRKNGNTRTTEEEFSWADADTAKLTSKDTYKQYGKRMLKMRARGFALRDAFPDVLKGLITREEAQDFPANGLNEPAGIVDKIPANAIDATPTHVRPAEHVLLFRSKWSAGEWGGTPLAGAPASVLKTYLSDMEEMHAGDLQMKPETRAQLEVDIENARRVLAEAELTEKVNAAMGGDAPAADDGNQNWGFTSPDVDADFERVKQQHLKSLKNDMKPVE